MKYFNSKRYFIIIISSKKNDYKYIIYIHILMNYYKYYYFNVDGVNTVIILFSLIKNGTDSTNYLL